MEIPFASPNTCMPTLSDNLNTCMPFPTTSLNSVDDSFPEYVKAVNDKRGISITKEFDCNRGQITIEDFAVKVTIPSGAIAVDDKLKFKVFVSLFGPYTLPEGYYPISAYVSITCDGYRFNTLVYIEIEHHAFISRTEDVFIIMSFKNL